MSHIAGATGRHFFIAVTRAARPNSSRFFRNDFCRRFSGGIPYHSSARRAGAIILPTAILVAGFTDYLYRTRQLLLADTLPAEQQKLELSSQHDQVLQFWDRPGVYVWGSNSGRVAAPDSTEDFIKAPQRISFFDGYVLRDLKLSREIGVAVTESGDLLQWGIGYSTESLVPEVTLKGKDIKKVEISKDKIIALSRSGLIYTLPFSKEDQEKFIKPVEQSSSWTSLWSQTPRAQISYRPIEPSLGATERVVDIAAGQEHALILTSSGRVFSFAASGTSYPAKGQMGIPGLSWESRPKGPFDMPHEITELGGLKITQIVAGDYHSIVVDVNGRIYTFGDNSNGQLGIEYAADGCSVPTHVPIKTFYRGEVLSKCVLTAAGGLNSYFVMETRDIDTMSSRSQRPTFDVFACGNGVFGALGTGKWSSAQAKPQKIVPLSGLFEYSDKQKQVVPIKISYFTVGATHAAVVLNNITNLKAAASKNFDVLFGSDILFFGGNEFYQLGTGKRNNLSIPTYIPPMDPVSVESLGKREEHRLQVVPSQKAKIVDQNGKNRSVEIEQKVLAGRGVTGCYAQIKL